MRFGVDRSTTEYVKLSAFKKEKKHILPYTFFFFAAIP